MRTDGAVVLLVEDSTVLRRVMARALRGAGYSVLEAADGAAAIALAASAEQPPCLLVSDLSLPGMDGRELAARLKAEHAQLQVLFVTGMPDLSLPEPILAKPFAPAELTAMVDQILGVDEG